MVESAGSNAVRSGKWHSTEGTGRMKEIQRPKTVSEDIVGRQADYDFYHR